MCNVIVSINVSLRETEDLATENDGVERMDDGSFRVVLDPQAEFNIDRLENALLQTSYPALRKALSDHLERASKKKPAKWSAALGAAALQNIPAFTKSMGRSGGSPSRSTT
jgi:hypothetical protein